LGAHSSRINLMESFHRLLPARSRVIRDCIRGTTCVHIGSVAPDKKLSFPPRFNYLFTFTKPEHSGLRHYFITTNTFDY
jgi:hypothetical protein